MEQTSADMVGEWDTNKPIWGSAIDLGCSCKRDLGATLKQWAKTWYKIKDT